MDEIIEHPTNGIQRAEPQLPLAPNGRRRRNTPEQVIPLLIVMFMSFDKEVSEERLAIMAEDLSDIGIERLGKAIARCRQECKFPPTTADIRERYNEARQKRSADSAALSERDEFPPRTRFLVEQETREQRIARLRATQNWGWRYGDNA